MVKFGQIHEIGEIFISFFCYTFFAVSSPKFVQILIHFAQSCDCMIAAFRNSGGRRHWVQQEQGTGGLTVWQGNRVNQGLQDWATIYFNNEYTTGGHYSKTPYCSVYASDSTSASDPASPPNRNSASTCYDDKSHSQLSCHKGSVNSEMGVVETVILIQRSRKAACQQC